MLKRHPGAAVITAALFSLGVLAIPGGGAHAAANFSVVPLLLNLSPDRPTAALTLGNKGAEAVTVQAELLAWAQDAEGKDVYSKAEGLLVTPPIFSVRGGGSQVIRVGRIKPMPPPAREQAYRLFITEVPPDAAVSEGAIATVMRLSVPLFVAPSSPDAKAKLEVRAEPLLGQDLRVRVANTGLAHGKVTGLALAQDGKSVGEKTLNLYVLPGASRELVWKDALRWTKPGTVDLRAQLKSRTQHVDTRFTAPGRRD